MSLVKRSGQRIERALIESGAGHEIESPRGSPLLPA
jgi:hypothetical protein